MIISATGDDINSLIDIDLKSHQYPLTSKQWTHLSQKSDYFIHMALDGSKPVGSVIWRAKPPVARIVRIGVKPKNRCKGFGTALLVAFELDALLFGCTEHTLIVPEILCFPGHPDDVSQWLLRRGYRATTLKSNYTHMYGQKVDGIKFVKTFARP